MSEVSEYEWQLTLEEIKRRIPNAKAILARAVVMRIGWEMDNEVCAVEMADGSKELIGTSHGGAYLCRSDELLSSIEDYEQALAQSKEVLLALKVK